MRAVEEWPLDVQLTEQLIARVRPVGAAAEYEIQLALLVDGELHLSGDPYRESLGAELDRSIQMLGLAVPAVRCAPELEPLRGAHRFRGELSFW